MRWTRSGALLGPGLTLAAVLGCSARQPAASPPATTTGLAQGIATADSIITASLGTSTAGTVLVVSQNGAIVAQRAYGYARLTDSTGKPLESPRPMRTSTVFDVASVTKVLATTLGVMLLVDRGMVALDAPVHQYLTDFRGHRLDSITVRHLLTHSSGLVQWQPLYYRASTASETYDVIRSMPLGTAVGAERRYSDLGFMLLGYLIERVTGQSLPSFLEQEFYQPLGLGSTG
ncbi:MAG: serine hydrolase domain-containing protein, partial [Gemmatimonadales bacterium]